MKARFSLFVILFLAIFQVACNLSQFITPTPHGDPLAPTPVAGNLQELTPTPHSTSTSIPLTTGTETVQGGTGQGPSVILNLNGVAESFALQVIASVLPGENSAWWEPMPQYTLISLAGYPIANDLIKPRMIIYPAEELEKANENAGKLVASLQSLIQSPREIPNMPFLPLTGDIQMMHAHLQYLDFKTGQGLRYLVEFGNGISPINNAGLIYTYQGITSDGKYYVTAVLPVNHPSLPADANITGKEPPEFQSDYPAYRAAVAGSLNIQAPNTFTPDLTQLDAMLSTLDIQ